MTSNLSVRTIYKGIIKIFFIKRAGILIYLSIFLTPLLLTAQIDTAWVRTYDREGGDDYAKLVAIDGLGNVYIAGASYKEGNNYDYLLIKYDAQGAEQWVSTYNGSDSGPDRIWAIQIDESGDVYVTGEVYDSITASDYTTIKYNGNGIPEWVARYDGLGSEYDYARSLCLDSDNNIYVTGFSEGLDTITDYATVKYNPGGAIQWATRYSGSPHGQEIGQAIAIDDSGDVFVTGSSQDSLGLWNFATIKYGSNGQQQWAAIYNGVGLGENYANALTVDAHGNAYVTGRSNSQANSTDYATIKYDKDGREIWVAGYNGSANGWDNPVAIDVDGNGNVYVTGTSREWNSFYDFMTIKYDTIGIEEWRVPFNGSVNDYDCPTSLVVDPLGNTYVTGFTTTEYTGFDWATIKYGPNGRELWRTIFNGPLSMSDRAENIVVDDSDYVYVCGAVNRSLTHDGDAAIIKYRQTTGVHEVDKKGSCEAPLLRVAPNPSWEELLISFAPARGSNVKKIVIFDAFGRGIWEYAVDKAQPMIIWPGKDKHGHPVPAGIYFIEYCTENSNGSYKIVRIQ